MRRKADRGLTAAGKRKGRKPHYLTEEQLAAPAANGGERVNTERSNSGWRFPYLGLTDEVLLRRVTTMRRALSNLTAFDLAYSVLQSLKLGHERDPKKIRAMETRIRRAMGEAAHQSSTSKTLPE